MKESLAVTVNVSCEAARPSLLEALEPRTRREETEFGEVRSNAYPRHDLSFPPAIGDGLRGAGGLPDGPCRNVIVA